MTARLDVLVAGELNPDAIVVTGGVEPEYGQVETLVEDGVLTVGSSGAIFACGCARLGLATGYVGLVGADAGGRFMLEELGRRGIDVGACRVDPDGPTGLTVVLAGVEDRAILTFPGAMGELRAGDVGDELLARAAHLHVSSPNLQPRLREGLAELFGRARAAGLTTSLDPGWDPTGSWGDGLEQALAATDVFLPNAAEACRFAGVEDPEAALDALAGRAGTVVVTLGPGGAIAAGPAGRARATAPAVAVVDGTGAGDSFAAGFLRGRHEGLPLERCLRLAVACGSLSTRALGGVDGQATWQEANEFERSFE
jgi:sugar/nucleoside kinase (ribokinase family)